MLCINGLSCSWTVLYCEMNDWIGLVHMSAIHVRSGRMFFSRTRRDFVSIETTVGRGFTGDAVSVLSTPVWSSTFYKVAVHWWAGVLLHNQTHIVFVDGNLNAERYQEEILQPHVLPLARANRGFTLVHDGATCHTARTTKTFLGNKRINTLAWPEKSPDLNVIEHI